MSRTTTMFLGAILVASVTWSQEALRESRRLTVKGIFGTAGFVDAERHDVAGLGFRFAATERFSIEPEVLFLRAPIDCYRCTESGRDEDVIATANFTYDFAAPWRRVVPYFLAGIGYLDHRETTAWWSSTSGSLWMHYGLGARVRLTDGLSLLPEVRVSPEGGYATIGVGYGFVSIPPRATGPRDFEVARSFQELRGRLEPGSRIEVTDASGERHSGVVDLFPAGGEDLTVRSVDGSVTFPLDDIYRIDVRDRDSLANGIAIGAGVGAGLGLLALASCDCEGAGYGVLFVAGMGAGLGMAIDALVPTKKILFLHPAPRSGVQVRVLPQLGRDRRGVLAVLSF